MYGLRTEVCVGSQCFWVERLSSCDHYLSFLMSLHLGGLLECVYVSNHRRFNFDCSVSTYHWAVIPERPIPLPILRRFRLFCLFRWIIRFITSRVVIFRRAGAR